MKTPYSQNYRGVGRALARGRGLTPAFTLVEMLTVVAIIVLLAGMLLPAVAEAQRRIHGTATKAQLRSIEVAVNAYRQEWRDFPISGFQDASGNFQADDGSARLYRAVGQAFNVAGRLYGPYYSVSDDERSTALSPTWTSTVLANTAYIIDKIPPGMPILYYRSRPGRQLAWQSMPYEHNLQTLVRPPPPMGGMGLPLSAHFQSATPSHRGSPWASGATAGGGGASSLAGGSGGRQNFFMLPTKLSPSTEAPQWRETPRWGVYASGATAANGMTSRLAKEGEFLLVSAGLDRRYGTIDDARNYDSQ